MGTSEFHYKRYVRTIRTHGKSNETYYFMFERDWNEDGWNDKDRDNVNYDFTRDERQFTCS